jgi:hypothetical protein
MSLGVWCMMFLVKALYSMWIVRWGGAGWIKGTFLSPFFGRWQMLGFEEEGLRLYAGCYLLVSACIFIAGIPIGSIRYFGP